MDEKKKNRLQAAAVLMLNGQKRGRGQIFKRSQLIFSIPLFVAFEYFRHSLSTGVPSPLPSPHKSVFGKSSESQESK